MPSVTQGHTASKREAWNLNACLSSSERERIGQCTFLN